MKILDNNLNFIVNLDNILDAKIKQGINKEYNLEFTAILDSTAKNYINHNYIVEADENYFDIVTFEQYRNDAGLFVKAYCEHISYRLNKVEYDKDYFTEDGTPEYILSKILEGTGFIVSTVDFNQIQTFSIQEKLSCRAILLEFASYIGAEIKYDKFNISLLQRLGSITGKEFKIGKDIIGIRKFVDARENVNGIPKLAYDIDVVELKTLPEFGQFEEFGLGDTVKVIDPDLEINTEVRIISYEYNPLEKINSKVEIQNFFSTLADDIFRIQRDTLAKGKLYHGIRISPDMGFEAIRSDEKARAWFNSDTLAMQSKEDGQWKNKLWFDPLEGVYKFDGLLSATAIEAISAEIDVVVSETVIVNNLYASRGRIAELTVDHLLTGDFLKGDETLFYIEAEKQFLKFMQAQRNDSLPMVQYTTRDGALLFWTDEYQKEMHTAETDYPVMVYQYDAIPVMQMQFEEITDSVGNLRVPTITLGRGDGVTPMSSKGRIYKDRKGMVVEYFKSNSGDRLAVTITDDGIEVPGNTGPKGLRNIAVGATPPTSPQNNDLWIDTTGGVMS
ncbi:phage minor structural protein, N-terminal region [Acetoanaerobium noterae]|uniref:Phage minor structural protein, N-terminal region n=1 Tax=Acetoanaerobium noterae TaxID=745369 RepID=A0A1T4ZZT0_9FIRM|nr:phage tail protein [Acetoanaerobium noterae]SKB28294.1 phage minor structural protein, N-terminal region [Acetoanaerobium noterae]